MNKFVVLDDETLGTPGDCGTTHVVMPSIAFVVWKGKEELPAIIYAAFNTAEQLFQGAKTSAGTIAFWMSEAKRGNPAADEIIHILNNPTVSGLQIWDTTCDGTWYRANNNYIYTYLKEFMEENRYNTLNFYGNGPDFDMTIYEANSYHSNLGRPLVPWKFWNIRSARNANEYDVVMSELKKDAEVWAHRVFKEYNIIPTTDHTPSKHNPIFDALVEAYIIAQTCEA